MMMARKLDQIRKWIGAMHWSYAERGWIGIIGIRNDGRALVRYELEFQQLTAEEFAMELFKFMLTHKIPELQSVILQEEHCGTPKRPNRDGVGAQLSRCGIPVQRGNDSDLASGWLGFRSWLTPQTIMGRTAPALEIHADCSRLIDTLPTIVADPKDPEHITETPDAFPAHALRRFCMSNPVPSPEDEPELPPGAIGHEVRALRRELARNR